jgi:hypothetical protein
MLARLGAQMELVTKQFRKSVEAAPVGAQGVRGVVIQEDEEDVRPAVRLAGGKGGGEAEGQGQEAGPGRSPSHQNLRTDSRARPQGISRAASSRRLLSRSAMRG